MPAGPVIRVRENMMSPTRTTISPIRKGLRIAPGKRGNKVLETRGSQIVSRCAVT